MFNMFNMLNVQFASETELSWKVNIFIVVFQREDFLSISKQITIISIIMQTQAKFCVCFTKINTKLFFCGTETFITTKSISFK